MKNFKDHFSDASNDYKTYRPQYPDELFKFLAELAPTTQHVWDCGCGNGQASTALADFFQTVSASDASEEQIKQAEKKINIQYSTSPAETIAAPDNSLDLITVAQAVHWFNHDAFFSEVNRVLKSDGVLAVWGYQLIYTDSPLDSIVKKLHTEIVGPYWPKGRELLDDGFSKIIFPYPRLEAPKFFMSAEWNFSELLGYLNTWSAVKRYQQEQQENPIELILNELKMAWGVNENERRRVSWPLILYLGKKL